MTTDRALWAEPMSSNWAFGNALVREGWHEDIATGLRAFAACWFDEYSDEENLPEAFHKLVAIAEENLLIALDIPRDDDDEEEDDDS